jgi:hypothetical protein
MIRVPATAEGGTRILPGPCQHGIISNWFAPFNGNFLSGSSRAAFTGKGRRSVTDSVDMRRTDCNVISRSDTFIDF